MRLLFALAAASSALAASLQQISGWGSGPAGVSMFVYAPDRLATNPAIVVATHPCGGSAQQMYSSTRLPSLADQHGFVLVYPQTTRYSNCWDVFSPGALTHGGGSDPGAIVSMVSHALSRYGGDASRVHVVGVSSGAMLANVLAGAYPDVFEAAASFSGVPAACFAGAPAATPMSPNQTCAQAQGPIVKTAREWGNFARNMYPGYPGRRTRMQIWHGTADTLVVFAHLAEQLKQWSDVLGVSLTREVAGVPASQYRQYVYGDGTLLQGYRGEGVGHTVPVFEQQLLEFFGILGTAGGPITPAPGPSQTLWGQCGGNGWNGPTTCVTTARCTTQNAWYAQCVPR
ncbi:Alpha/Beta hydrolase protein [Plectosphaerella plurivora]|uniref:Carboxylic ester hydrolase n=1 Tax=Plectosphaerella plurivora TaxID=936078 RepID=A0A9P8V4F7_9PEZI|nr:Alpha/Beta hydrolase protein [Plectosphaerella plurivora]